LLVQDDMESLKRKLAEMQQLVHEEHRSRRAAEQRAEEAVQQSTETQRENVEVEEENKRLAQAYRKALLESDRNSPTLDVEAALRQPIALGLGDAIPNVSSSYFVNGLARGKVDFWENLGLTTSYSCSCSRS